MGGGGGWGGGVEGGVTLATFWKLSSNGNICLSQIYFFNKF